MTTPNNDTASPTQTAQAVEQQRLVRLLDWVTEEKNKAFDNWLNKKCTEKHKTIYLAHSEAMRETAEKINSLLPNVKLNRRPSDAANQKTS